MILNEADFISKRPATGDGSAMHAPPLRQRVIEHRAVHAGAVVPDHQIANAPVVPIHIRRAGDVRDQLTHQISGFRFTPIADCLGQRVTEIQAFFAGDRVRAHQRMHHVRERCTFFFAAVGFGAGVGTKAVSRLEPRETVFQIGRQALVRRRRAGKQCVADGLAILLRYLQAIQQRAARRVIQSLWSLAAPLLRVR